MATPTEAHKAKADALWAELLHQGLAAEMNDPEPGERTIQDAIAQALADEGAAVEAVVKAADEFVNHCFSHEGRFHSHAGVSCAEYVALEDALRVYREAQR